MDQTQIHKIHCALLTTAGNLWGIKMVHVVNRWGIWCTCITQHSFLNKFSECFASLKLVQLCGAISIFSIMIYLMCYIDKAWEWSIRNYLKYQNRLELFIININFERISDILPHTNYLKSFKPWKFSCLIKLHQLWPNYEQFIKLWP